MTTVKPGHRTYNHPYLGEIRTRGTSTGDLYPYHYTNKLHAESKIQMVHNRNTIRLSIKIYAGIATLAFAREPSTKAKQVQRSRQGSNILPRMRAVCVSPLYQSELVKWPYIYYLNDKAVKLTNGFWGAKGGSKQVSFKSRLHRYKVNCCVLQ